jgi:spore germination protein
MLVAACTSIDPDTTPTSPPTSGPATPPVIVIAYVPYWDQERGFAVARAHIATFDQISPMWYSLREDGSLTLADDTNTTIDIATVRTLQQNGLQVLPTLTNLRNGNWDYEILGSVLARDELQRRHVDAIVDLVLTNNYDGIDIDYEDLRATDRDAYTHFLTLLSEALHSAGKLLTSGALAKTSEPGPEEFNIAQDYAAIGSVCDQVRLTTYDYHWATSEPGPSAPVAWVEEVVAWAVTQIPPAKVVLGCAILGYDWPAGGSGATVTYQEAMSLASAYGAEISRSDGALTFTYVDADGRDHEVWFEDAQSTLEKVELVERYGLGGVFFWRLGGEDPGIWSALGY